MATRIRKRSLRGKRRRVKARRWRRRLVRRVLRGILAFMLISLLVIGSLRWINPPINYYQASEWVRTGSFNQDWIAIKDMSRHLPLSAVAAEDANFCTHFGFDVDALRLAIESGGRRGGSTITQQTAKNVFLWQGRSWVRKGLEAGLTPVIELFWGKRRVLEIYLNVAEFDAGVFGVEAAMQHYFGTSARSATPTQAARLMAILPNPKARSASRPGEFTARRARAIVSGAGTIRADGRADCFL